MAAVCSSVASQTNRSPISTRTAASGAGSSELVVGGRQRRDQAVRAVVHGGAQPGRHVAVVGVGDAGGPVGRLEVAVDEPAGAVVVLLRRDADHRLAVTDVDEEALRGRPCLLPLVDDLAAGPGVAAAALEPVGQVDDVRVQEGDRRRPDAHGADRPDEPRAAAPRAPPASPWCSMSSPPRRPRAGSPQGPAVPPRPRLPAPRPHDLRMASGQWVPADARIETIACPAGRREVHRQRVRVGHPRSPARSGPDVREAADPPDAGPELPVIVFGGGEGPRGGRWPRLPDDAVGVARRLGRPDRARERPDPAVLTSGGCPHSVAGVTEGRGRKC